LCRTYLGAPEALDILVKANVFDRFAVDIDRPGLSGASQYIPDTSSTITEPGITTTLLFAIYERFTEGAVISLHVVDPEERVFPVDTF
jgi:hypothetical protein